MTAFPETQLDEPPVEDQPAPSLADQPVATISRVTFNYVIIGVVALAVGVLLGYFGYERVASRSAASNNVSNAEIQAAVSSALTEALAALPNNLDGTVNTNIRHDVGVVDNPFRGPEDAVVTLIEFGDFHCGFCKRFHDETVASLMEQFDGRVRLVFRDFPVLGPDSLSAALAAECADDQGKFWEFHDMLYQAPSELTRDAFMLYATALELDTETFATCFDTQQHRDEVIQDYTDGQALGVTGTPTFFINGKILVGAQPLDQFIMRIEAELAEIDAQNQPS